MIDQKTKNQEHVFNNSEISYEEYIEDTEEVEKERAKSFDAPRRVLSLVKKKYLYIILTFVIFNLIFYLYFRWKNGENGRLFRCTTYQDRQRS